jgi:predicted nucleic acid-binding protein
MIVLLDANIVIDFLVDREPFSQEANEILKACYDKRIDAYIAAHSVTNIFYILRKIIRSPIEKRRYWRY